MTQCFTVYIFFVSQSYTEFITAFYYVADLFVSQCYTVFYTDLLCVTDYTFSKNVSVSSGLKCSLIQNMV